MSRKVVVISDSHLGLFTLIAVTLIVLSFIWWKGYPWAPPPQRFSVVFHDVGGLNPNAAVNINGMRVGNVEHLSMVGPDSVRVHIKIASKEVRVPVGAKVHIFTNGLVGAKYVEIVLPRTTDGQEQKLLDQDSTVIGVDPVRTEFMVNNIARSMNELDIEGVQGSLKLQMARLGDAADNVSVLSRRLRPTADGITALSVDLRGTSRRMNKILDNPEFSRDLKETAHKAREAAERIQAAIDRASDTLGDEAVRKDVVTALNQLNSSTQNIEDAVKGLSELARDDQVRADVKQIASDARDTMTRVSNVVSKPGFGRELRGTLSTANSALTELNMVGQRMNRILSRRAPLFHLMFGRPGRLTVDDVTRTAGTPRAGDEAPKRVRNANETEAPPSGKLLGPEKPM